MNVGTVHWCPALTRTWRTVHLRGSKEVSFIQNQAVPNTLYDAGTKAALSSGRILIGLGN